MNLFTITITILTFVFSWFAYPQLPEQLPMHWNIQGEVDRMQLKTSATWMLPLMMLVMSILFSILPKLDPKKDKYQLFEKEWRIIQGALISFFAYIQFAVLYISTHPQTQMMPLMFIGMGSLFTLMGNLMSKIRQNYFIGVRTPWTLADEENWNKTHRFASWSFVIAGILTLTEAFFIWNAPAVILGSILIASFLPMIYSFLLYKKAESKMKYVYAGLALVLLIITLLRLSSPEDTWICEKGQWIRHGNPNLLAPNENCK